MEVHHLGEGGKPVRLADVAAVTNISKRFLEQLAIALKNHSILRGICGRNGGYVLGRAADEITIGDVLRAVIGPIELAVCTEEPTECMAAEFCQSRLVWLLIKQRINDVINEYTIADMSDRASLEAIRHALRMTNGVPPQESRAAMS